MMNKGYKNFNGGLSDDLDIDRVDDFVNQVESFSMDNLLSELGQYGQEGSGVTAESITTGAGAVQATSPEAVKNQALLAKRRNRGKGLGAFAKGLGQGLGLLGAGQQQQPLQQAQATEPSQAGFQKERGDWVIPTLIGAIGLAVVIFAFSQSKKGKSSAQPMPVS